MSTSQSFDAPDRCVVGTVGGPGERAFYLQVRQGSIVYSMLFEKEQARLLAIRMGELLEEASARGDLTATGQSAPADNGPLDMPLAEEFRIMRLSVAWLRKERVLVLEAGSGQDPDEDETGDASRQHDNELLVSVQLTPAYAREFIRRTLAVVSAGRRNCPLCEQPIHPSGHVCPRANGYHRLR